MKLDDVFPPDGSLWCTYVILGWLCNFDQYLFFFESMNYVNQDSGKQDQDLIGWTFLLE